MNKSSWMWIEYDILLTEQLIGGLNDQDITDEILREVAISENILRRPLVITY